MDSKKLAAAVAEGATTALDRATVEALEGAARAAEAMWTEEPSGDLAGEINLAIRFDHLASPGVVLKLIAAWKDQQILAGQNEMAFNANRDLGASNDDLRLEVCRLENALREIAKDSYGLQGIIEDFSHDQNALSHHKSKYWEKLAFRLKAIARTALEGSARRG